MKVISEKPIAGTNRNERRFEMVTDEKPTYEDISAAQLRLGYHPAGYAGPWDIKSEKDGENWKTTWGCAHSCE